MPLAIPSSCLTKPKNPVMLIKIGPPAVVSKLNLYQLLSPWVLLFLGYLYADQANVSAVHHPLKPINQYNPLKLATFHQYCTG